MNAKEIEALVKSHSDMPSKMNFAESYYFLALDCLRYIRIPPEEKEKRYLQISQAFEDGQRMAGIYRDTCNMRVELASVAKEMTKGSCPICKEAIAIIDGRKKQEEK